MIDKIAFEVNGPDNTDDGTLWNVMMTVGGGSNKYLLVRKGGYKTQKAAVKSAANTSTLFKKTVEITCKIVDVRARAADRMVLDRKELEKIAKGA